MSVISCKQMSEAGGADLHVECADVVHTAFVQPNAVGHVLIKLGAVLTMRHQFLTGNIYPFITSIKTTLIVGANNYLSLFMDVCCQSKAMSSHKINFSVSIECQHQLFLVTFIERFLVSNNSSINVKHAILWNLSKVLPKCIATQASVARLWLRK